MRGPHRGLAHRRGMGLRNSSVDTFSHRPAPNEGDWRQSSPIPLAMSAGFRDSDCREFVAAIQPHAHVGCVRYKE